MTFEAVPMTEFQRAQYAEDFERDGCTYDPGDCNMIDRRCFDEQNNVGLCIGSDEADWCLFCGEEYELERSEDEH